MRSHKQQWIIKSSGLAPTRSLCIIDEFGKGTLTSDGVGLLCAVLQRFARCDAPPKVVACTHFSEVLDSTFLPKCALWCQNRRWNDLLCG